MKEEEEPKNGEERRRGKTKEKKTKKTKNKIKECTRDTKKARKEKVNRKKQPIKGEIRKKKEKKMNELPGHRTLRFLNPRARERVNRTSGSAASGPGSVKPGMQGAGCKMRILICTAGKVRRLPNTPLSCFFSLLILFIISSILLRRGKSNKIV